MTEIPSAYTISCIGCGGISSLAMYAHRKPNGNGIVGWFFVCDLCDDMFVGKKLNWTLDDAVEEKP